MVRARSAALAVLLVAAGPAAAETASPAALIEALRQGGHVVFVRHARTERDYADQVSAVMGDCSTQRPLSAAGWQEARVLGAAFTAHAIPVAAVRSSEYCRAWQTADLAFGRHLPTADLNFQPAETYTEAQLQVMRDGMHRHLAMVPPAGFNTILVGHDDPFEAATGIYPEPMGVTFVLRPDGQGSFAVLGSIAPDAWFD